MENWFIKDKKSISIRKNLSEIDLYSFLQAKQGEGKICKAIDFIFTIFLATKHPTETTTIKKKELETKNYPNHHHTDSEAFFSRVSVKGIY